MEYKSSFHSVYCLTFHAVFVVKYRRKALSAEMLEFLKEYISELMEIYGGSLLEFNGEADHIHVLFELPPNVMPSSIINNLKTQTSKELRKRFMAQISGYLSGNAFWSASYFLSTTGGASIETIERYIQDQGKPKRKYVKRNT